MKITEVDYNNRRKVFSVTTEENSFDFPYARVEPMPDTGDFVRSVFADPELGNEGFTFTLKSGREGSVPLDAVLEFNRDPDHLRDLMLYHLTIALQRAVEESGISKRELIKRLKTSPSQFYRVLNPASPQKSFGQILKIFYALDRDPEVLINSASSRRGKSSPKKNRYAVTAKRLRSVA